jgi:nitrite reductase/ring-hydroxylating ferredoxin subunit/uncharacterized membrane protein
MKSKAHIKSHPIHPILVNFPIAFFSGTLLFDALSYFTGNAGFCTTGQMMNLAGIITAAIAAVPGFIDFLFTVPPNSTGKKRAAQHGILNVIVLLLFVMIFYYRQTANSNKLTMLAFETAGVAILVVSGWMGGTLVHRNQIGIDIRYAGAGKWKEEYFSTKETKVKIAEASELNVNQMKLVHLNGKRIVLGRTEDGFVAFDDRCTHRGGSLAGGSMICGTVQCPWHGSQFDVNTGEAKCGPAAKKIRTYPIEEIDGEIFIQYIAPQTTS